MKISLIVALSEEYLGIEWSPVYISGVGKINATMAAMTAIADGADIVINYGSAGAVNDTASGLVKVTGYVDRDMDATAQGFKLGQTPFENEVMLGHLGMVAGTGDSFVTSQPRVACDIVDMESIAIAKVCAKHSVEFHSFKYISDAVGDDPNVWRSNVSKGNEIFQREVLDKINQWGTNIFNILNTGQ